MEIKSITIRRLEGYEKRNSRHPDDTFAAKICLVGGSDYPADINMEIPKDVLEPIVRIIAQATASAMAEATKQFHDDVQAMLSGPVVDALAIAN